MTVLIVVACAILLAAALRLAVARLRRHKMASELDQDWWPQFEREFWAYARSQRRDASLG